MPGEQPDELTVVGIGMIGASFALACRSRFARISAVDPNVANLAAAEAAGIIDEALEAVPADAAAVLIACPSDRIAGWVLELAEHPGIVFDAGSVKGTILEEIVQQRGSLPRNFVPSHPIAGLERSGPEAADAGLFQGRKAIITPTAETDVARQAQVADWWSAAGARVEIMDPAEHDAVYARTSHLPHLLAFAYLLGIERDDLVHTGGGFRDFSRIGGSDPVMWSGVFERNRSALLAGLDRFEADLADFRAAIDAGDTDRCRSLIAAARARREALES
ncbi:MAG: prephenate dehydrogenase/arogenate dehydrogenase family protein [Pseudomonadota bacterium]